MRLLFLLLLILLTAFPASAGNAALDYPELARCSAEKTSFARSFCFLKAAEAHKDKAVCDRITGDDQYFCYAKLAELMDDTRLCFDIPSGIRLASREGKEYCYSRVPSLNPRVNSSLRDKKIFLKSGDSVIERICFNALSDNGGGRVARCGVYYRVDPPMGVADMPVNILDKNGALIAECGGMPGPGGPAPNPPECDQHCEDRNLCADVHIDCSQMALPAVIPSDYEGQIEYYKKKSAYKYLGLTAEEAVNLCQSARR